MKNLYLTFIALAFSGIAFSQNDTLLWEDFEAETIDYILNELVKVYKN